jgi:hypothetical protein
MSLPPSEIPAGAMRFNSDSQKLEYWNGSAWFQVHTFSPNLDGGARAVWAGGSPSPGGDTIEYVNISSTGDAQDFGNLASNKKYTSGFSSSTRGINGGGELPGPGNLDVIEFITISSTGNAQDFGDLGTSRTYISGCSNETRGLFGGGKQPGFTNEIEYVTNASTGDAVDFGTLTQSRSNIGAVANPIRGVFQGGYTPTNQNTIDFVTIATLGNAQDFGDISNSSGTNANQSGSTTRGFFIGGSGDTTIDYFNFATTGNTINFGSSTIDLEYSNCTSDKVRLIRGGGQAGPGARDSIEYLIISTEGDAVDFGDLITDQHLSGACFSNAHGGL